VSCVYLYIDTCQPDVDKNKKHSNKLSGEVFSHIGWFDAVFHQIIILYIEIFGTER